nr:transposase [Clostridium gasigenes]
MDAIHYKVREDKYIVVKAAYVVIGVNLDGKKEVLGICIGVGRNGKLCI